MLSYAAQPDQPARPAGDRLLPVGVAGRPQADPVPEHQPRPPGAGPLPRRTRRSTSSGMISPPILLRRAARAAVAAGWRLARRRHPAVDTSSRRSGSTWFVGTFLPFVAAEPDRQPDELPVLHGDRDARDLRRGGGDLIVRWRPDAAAGRWLGRGCVLVAVVRHVSVHPAPVTRGRQLRSISAATSAATRAGRVDHGRRRRACASRSAGGARSCGCAASSPRRRRPAARRTRAPCGR